MDEVALAVQDAIHAVREIAPDLTHQEPSPVDDELLWRKDGAGLPVEYGVTYSVTPV